MNETMTETYNKLFDLANSTYTSWLNAMLWGTERVLEFNKSALVQLEASQTEARKYAEEMGAKTRQGVQLVQELIQENIKVYSNGITNLRTATESSVNDVNRKLDELQQQFVATAAQAN